MIKAKKGRVQGKGYTPELLADLAEIVRSLIEEDIKEEMIDVAVGLGKALAKGEGDEFKLKTLKEALEKKGKKVVTVDLMGLIKQAKEMKEKEENED